jgi:hypothetical protein
MPLEELTIGKDLTYQEYPVKILDTSEKSPGIIATRCAKCSGVTIAKTKPHGKKKISWRQSFEISFPICLNIGGEIHPVGGRFVTPWFSEEFKTCQATAFHLNSNWKFLNNLIGCISWHAYFYV